MLLSTFLPLLPFALAQVRPHHPGQRHAPRQPHPAQLEQTLAERDAAAAAHQLDERGMPITATTTVWHMVTETQTVWVRPTDQAVFEPVVIPSGSGYGGSAVVTGSSAGTEHSHAESGTTSHASATGSSSATVHVDSASPSSTHSNSDSSQSSSSHSHDSTGTASPTSIISTSSAISTDASSSHSGTDSHSHSSSSIADPTVSVESASITSSSSALAEATGASSYVPYSRSSGSGEPQALPWSTSVSLSSSASSVSHTDSASSSGMTQSSVSHSDSSSSHLATSTASASSVVPTSSTSSSDSHSHSSTASESSLHEAAVTSSSASTSSSLSASTPSVESTVSPSLNSTTSASSTASSPSSSSSSSSSPSTTSVSTTSSVPSNTTTSSTSTSTTSTSPSPSPSASTGLPPVPSKIMAGYYPDWSSWYLAPENIDFSKFDILDFAFAIPTESGGLEFTQNDSSDLLHRLVKVAHAHGRRVKLSIGGWTGSKFFSPITADGGKRATFVKAMVDAYHTYNLDGIDIDWEYPGAGGAWGNIVSSSDSANYLTMLQELRAALPNGALITLATQVWPFTGSNGSPLKDVRGFAAVIDWILIMNYDIWGSSSTPGPNAPLSDACGNSTQPLANAYASVSSWTQAGLSPSQITIGVPAYGYLQQSWATSLRQRDIVPAPADYGVDANANATTIYPVRERRGMEKRYTTVSSGWSTTEGQVMWHDLVSQGALTRQWNGEWAGSGGFTRYWDECSSTPWLKSTQSGQIVTYDDPQSMSLKGQFAAQAGLRGCNVFSVDGDWTNGEWPLTDATRSGLGL